LLKSVKDAYVYSLMSLIPYWPKLFRAKIAAEAQHGLISQVLKDYIFSIRPGLIEEQSSSSDYKAMEGIVETALG